MTTLEQQIMQAMLDQIGKPYIWCGKGDQLWHAKGAVPNTFGQNVFDCSGLVTWAFWKCSLGDFRMKHSAQTLYNKLREVPGGSATAYLAGHPALAFYGMRTDAITHVGLVFNLYGKDMTVEAAGGGSTTNFPVPGACVKLHAPNRRDLIGVRALPTTTSDLT